MVKTRKVIELLKEQHDYFTGIIRDTDELLHRARADLDNVTTQAELYKGARDLAIQEMKRADAECARLREQVAALQDQVLQLTPRQPLPR